MTRPAQPSDVEAMLALVRELARYEKEPDAVRTDEPRLREALFGPDPKVFALVATDDSDAVVGLAIWFVNYSTWTGRHGIYLEDLVVSERVRGEGHGRALMAELARLCGQRGYARFEWSVLDWNEPALRFYRALGAQPMSDWTVHRLSGEQLRTLAESI